MKFPCLTPALLCGVLLCWSAAFAQDTKIERLQAELNEYSAIDTHRVQLLLDLGRGLMRSDSKESQRCYMQAEKLARKIGDLRREASAGMMLGWLTARFGDPVKGIGQLQSAERKFRAAGDTAGLMRCMNAEAGLLSMQGQHNEAMIVAFRPRASGRILIPFCGK